MPKRTNVSWKVFLKDVLLCSLGAYGGPEAHYGVFTDQMVTKKQYLTEEELVELIALTGVLPGPSSTQTLIAIGVKTGGPLLGFLTLLVWALPAIVVMTLLSFFITFQVSNAPLRFIGPMAVGFILLAAVRISKKVLKTSLAIVLFLLTMILAYFIRSLVLFPLLLLLGGFLSVILSNEKEKWQKKAMNPPWHYLIIFIIFALGSPLLALLWQHRLSFLFQHFYQYGYLVIGGGQVVIPYMVTDLVLVHELLSIEEFLSGFGLVQGIPGPMFSFSAYAGGLAARDLGTFMQIMGALIAGVSIFLPGVLLIFFVYPIWETLRQIKGIQIALKGVLAVAAGLISVAAIILMQNTGFTAINLIFMGVTFLALLSKKIPAPFIVGVVIALGFLI